MPKRLSATQDCDKAPERDMRARPAGAKTGHALSSRLSMLPFRLAALALFLASPAAAADSPACRASCGAVAQSRAANPVPVQACLIRCEASARYQAGLRGGQAVAQGRVAVAGPVRGMP